MLKIYGIKNCSTMKKAFAQLDIQQLAYDFHDYKKQSIDLNTLEHWVSVVGLEVLLNKKGTTWRKFSPEQQVNILSSAQQTLQAMQDNPSMIKRPVLVTQDQILVGFDSARYAQLAE